MADVVGYSRLMERDESGTHARLRALHEELVAPRAKALGGRLVKTAGDGFLLEFPSATSALRWAIDIQRELGKHDRDVPPETRLQLRIGINLGDVIVEGDDIIGDGVNIAARLESLAEPGGICVAASVREQVHEDLGVEFVDAGDQHVKNIQKAIHVYRVALRNGAATTPSVSAAASAGANAFAGRRAALAVGTFALLAAVATATWQWTHRPGASDAAPPPLSLLILPFAAPAHDAVLEPLAEALGADVTRAIVNGMRDWKVVPPGIAGVGRQTRPGASTVGQEAGVRYVLEGDVRAAGDEIGVTLVLTDAVLGKSLASERRAVNRTRLAQDKGLLGAQLADATRQMLRNADARRIAAEPISTRDARSLVERGSATYRFGDLAAIRAARKHFREAIDKDPNLVAARVWHGYSLYEEFWVDFAGGRDERLLAALDDDSRRALELDDRDIRAWDLRMDALQLRWQFDAALEANERARAIDTSQAGRLLLDRMSILVLMGRSEDALNDYAAFNAMGGPRDSDAMRLACIAYVYLGRFDDAIANCGRASVDSPDYWIYLVLTAAYAQTDDLARAEAAKAQLMKRVPDFTISRFLAKQFSNNPRWIEQIRTHVVPGLRKAGVPE
jgi:class 3 adenylate cyclase/TolB-like protein